MPSQSVWVRHIPPVQSCCKLQRQAATSNETVDVRHTCFFFYYCDCIMSTRHVIITNRQEEIPYRLDNDKPQVNETVKSRVVLLIVIIIDNTDSFLLLLYE
jgi:hypothetical protein